MHGDVIVWGGPARLRYHGVMPLKEGHHGLLGGYRVNLTFARPVSGEDNKSSGGAGTPVCCL